MQKLKEQMRGKDLAYYAANLPPDATYEVSIEVVGDSTTLTPEQIAGGMRIEHAPLRVC